MSFIPAAEAALDGRGHTAGAAESLDLVEVESPPVFDAEGLRALLAPLFAGFLWGAAVFREMVAAQPLDGLALALRVLALALSLRAVLGIALVVRRLRVRFARARYGLVLGDEGLLYRTPLGDVVLLKQDILDVRERGDWRGKGGRRWADVYVITRPESGRLFVALPPLFTSTPGMLAERLMRWRGQSTEPSLAGGATSADELSSKLWERVAAGERPAGVSVIAQGRGWLARGPYASVLVGVAVLDGYLRLPASARAAIGGTGPALLAVLLLGVPISWIMTTRRSLAKQRGIALLLTARELLFRTRSGVMRVAWSSVGRVEVQARTAWSIPRGAHEMRTLILHRKNVEDIYYAESLLGVPAEVAAGLCDSYRKASAASEPVPAS